MSFEPSDFQEPVASTLTRKLAAALIPVVAAVPVTVAVVGNNKPNVPSAAEMNAMLGAEMQEETVVEEEAPSGLSSVAGLPVDQTNGEGSPEQVEDSETKDAPPKSKSSGESPADLADASLEDTTDGLPEPKDESDASAAAIPGNTQDDSEAEESLADSHTVEPGDTLYGIGQKYGLTADEIADANGIPVDKPIIPGQVLDIPEEGETRLAIDDSPDLPSGGNPLPSEPFEIEQTPGTSAGDFVIDNNTGPPAGPVAMDTQSFDYDDSYDSGFSPPAEPNYIPPSIPEEILPIDEPLSEPQEERRGFGWGKSRKQQAKPNAQYCIAYVVHRGDTLESIAFSHSTTEEIIKAMNHSTVITPGQVIMIPVDGIMTSCR
ncbi:MAG: LysM peptidoglycan-binding domain-containing protein [Verrucomicrobiota bacterium]